MKLDTFASFIRYLHDTKNHRTFLIGARRGKGKSYTSQALVDQMLARGIPSHFFQNPQDIKVHGIWFLLWDDAGPALYKRDSMKTKNKEASKALQRLRGAIPLLMLNVVDIDRLDIDLREDFGLHGTIIKHGFMEIEGVILEEIKPVRKPPSDTAQRQQEVLDAFMSLANCENHRATS